MFRSARSSSAGAAKNLPLVFRGFGWEHGVYSARSWAPRGPPLPPQSRAPPRSLCDAAFLRLQHGRLFHPLAGDGPPARIGPNPPRIFYVNWFRKGEDGKFIWPGFGENMRVLAWVFATLRRSTVAARETPIGIVPPEECPGHRPRVAMDVSPRGHRRAVAGGQWRSGGQALALPTSTSRSSTICRRSYHDQLKALEQRLRLTHIAGEAARLSVSGALSRG